MSRKCDHDWFDHYMMYSMMSNKSGGGNIGCGPIHLQLLLFVSTPKTPSRTSFLPDSSELTLLPSVCTHNQTKIHLLLLSTT